MKAGFALSSAFCLTTSFASAASLQVAPVLLDIPAPGAATTITLRNTDLQPITAQIRVFRWTQSAGEDRLEPTSDVVASPPLIDLRSRQDYTVRVVRVSGGPVAKQEAYRLVIDELPRPQQRSGTVALVLRHVVPVFFTGREVLPPEIAWSVSRHGKGLLLGAANAGDARLRLASVSIRDAAGKAVSANAGLVGYSLGRSSMRWTLASPGGAPAAGAKVTITGATETGPFNATAVVQPAP
ncbi:molecular chaperone [Bosea caraganae]|uniref:Molecular chaperone n=1 Tax=Bosea caraganae TaxID=2763117 RepID=A0A370L8X2_9HYPH|nr:molecular chaperone [Bosea caraganae]RDJ26833.1 molecular chaperone [Bosea caraganae]RDJ30719.1 molecular chaperone [Bosea caraganae]